MHFTAAVGEIMRITFLRVALVLFAVTSVAAQSLNWREYKNPGGNFSVLMPSDPSDTANHDPEGDSHTIQAADHSVGYNVFYVKFSQGQTVDDANFKSHRDAFLGNFPDCKLSDEQPAAPAISGFIGGSYRLNCELPGKKKTRNIGNLYLGRRYFYGVFALFVPESAEPPEVKNFVDSFRLIDPAK
jgi:hypothetical protein